MALRESDLYVSTPRPRPELALVPPPPKRHGFAAAAFVILLCVLLSVPVVSAVLDGPPPVPIERPRPVAAGSILSLDRISGVSSRDLPRSAEPVAGIAFVRCTGLWVAEPDGSNPQRLLALSGVASPEFSANGRSIAFLRSQGSDQSLWVAAADGRDVRRIGPITSEGAGLDAQVTGLAWSPNGDKIAFALTDGVYGPVTGGSAIWTLDVASGKFDRITSGWPAPTWHRDKIVVAGYDSRPDMQITLVDGPERVVSPKNSRHDELAVAEVPQGWWNTSRNGNAILRETSEGLELAIRTGWNHRDRLVAEPPPGYRFARYAQPTINQDGSRVAIDLLDPGSGRDLGLLNPRTGKWDVLDYAWEPSASPTPTILGPISRSEAREATEMLFNIWSRRWTRVEMLTQGRTSRSIFPWQYFGWSLDEPYRSEGHWVVPAITYSNAWRDEPNEYRSTDVVVRRIDGRLTATPTNLGPMVRVRTLEDAHEFAEAALGRSLPPLPSLPAGTRLANNYALSAWGFGGDSQATINTVFRGGKGSGVQRLTFSFGGAVDFSLGCGGMAEPEPIEVAGQPAMAAESEGINKVVWPATPEEPTGPLAIHGNVSRKELIELAEQMGLP